MRRKFTFCIVILLFVSLLIVGCKSDPITDKQPENEENLADDTNGVNEDDIEEPDTNNGSDEEENLADLTDTPYTKKIARLTGEPKAGETLINPNNTPDDYQLLATDLGIMWDKGDGEIFIAFGDSYGQGWNGSGAGPDSADWRTNLLAVSDDKDPEDGLAITSMIEDEEGHAKEIISAERERGGEWTVIPTAGVSVGDRHFIHYMSVNRWGENGRWFTNYGGLAYSDDDGQHWTKANDIKWENDPVNWDNHFQQAAFIKDDGYVYMFGTRSGRHGNVHMARVPEDKDDILDKSKYRYWDGGNWVTDESDAQPVVKGSAGELSVAYNTHYNRWIMTYSNAESHRMVMRHSETLTGPWSGETTLLKQKDYPAAYTGFIHPWFNDGQELYFNTTQWDPYNVFWMKTELSDEMFEDNMLSDPSFEDQASDNVSKPWFVEGLGGIDREIGVSHSGENNAWLRARTEWNALKQTVFVERNTDYTFTGWVRTSDLIQKGYLGVRVPRGGEILEEVEFGKMDDYTELKVSFNSKNYNRIEVYAGMWASYGDTFIQLDDFSLTKD